MEVGTFTERDVRIVSFKECPRVMQGFPNVSEAMVNGVLEAGLRLIVNQFPFKKSA